MALFETLSDIEKDALLKGVQLFSQMLWGPTSAQCEEMVTHGILREIRPLSPYVNIDLSAAVREINAWITAYEDAESVFDYLESCYVGLFISNRKGRVIPLYESCYEYENAPMMGEPASKMKTRLAAEGLSMGDHLNEPPDHLAVELEYLYYLLSTSFSNNDSVPLEKASQFASNDVIPWVQKLRKRLSEQEGEGFYLSLITLILVCLSFIGDMAPPN